MQTKDLLSALERQGRDNYKRYAKYRVKVPHSKSGPWTISSFETHWDLAYLRLARDGRAPGLGKFTALRRDGGVIMSDTIPEVDDFLCHVHKLRGNVLVTGLGMGMVLHILTQMEEYSKHIHTITVVEKDPHVLKLSAPYYRKLDPRITIVKGDAYKWLPKHPNGVAYDCAWHDIWEDIGEENLSDMRRMKEHYRKVVPMRQQFCWGEQWLRDEARGNTRRWG